MYKLKDWREAKEQYTIYNTDNLKNVKCFKLFEFLTFFYKIKNDQNGTNGKHVSEIVYFLIILQNFERNCLKGIFIILRYSKGYIHSCRLTFSISKDIFSEIFMRNMDQYNKHGTCTISISCAYRL